MLLALQGYYAILDVLGTSVELAEVVRRAGELLAAGPCCLQLRGKQLPPATLCQLGHELRVLAHRKRVPLCINDRLDVALAVRADAVHLGQDDLPLAEALAVRAAARASRLAIGVSTHNLVQARAAAKAGADYIGFGPMFPTSSKMDAVATVGLAALRKVAMAVKVPVVAIGGITLHTVSAVASAGASAAAVIAAVDQAPDRTLAGRRIAAAFRPSRRART